MAPNIAPVLTALLGNLSRIVDAITCCTQSQRLPKIVMSIPYSTEKSTCIRSLMEAHFKPLVAHQHSSRRSLLKLLKDYIVYMQSISFPTYTIPVEKSDDLEYLITMLLSRTVENSRFVPPRWRDEPTDLKRRSEYHIQLFEHRLKFHSWSEWFGIVDSVSRLLRSCRSFAAQATSLLTGYNNKDSNYPKGHFESLWLSGDDLIFTMLGTGNTKHREHMSAVARDSERTALRKQICTLRALCTRIDLADRGKNSEWTALMAKEQMLEDCSAKQHHLAVNTLSLKDVSSLTATCKSAMSCAALTNQKPRLRIFTKSEVTLLGTKVVGSTGQVSRRDLCRTTGDAYLPETPLAPIKIGRKFEFVFGLICPCDDAGGLVYFRRKDAVVEISMRISLVHANDDAEVDPTQALLVMKDDHPTSGRELGDGLHLVQAVIFAGPMYAKNRSSLMKGLRLKVAPCSDNPYANTRSLTARSAVFTPTKGWTPRIHEAVCASSCAVKCNSVAFKDRRVLYHRVLESTTESGVCSTGKRLRRVE